MFDDHDALLAGVLADPVADLPRLVYADFLEERGTPADAARSEFIRAQCELAAGPPPDLQRQLHLRVREKLLLNDFAVAWLAPLRARGEALQNPGTHGLFRRGFVETVWMPAAIFAAKAGKLFARVPAAELRVTRATLAELQELLWEPHATRLTTLDLSDRRLGDAAVGLLVASPVLAGLHTLRLRACGLTAASAEVLCGAPAAWSPARLDLDLNALTPAGVASLRDRYGTAVIGA
jgi:uncharacterized protein (TIGR02996 family)